MAKKRKHKNRSALKNTSQTTLRMSLLGLFILFLISCSQKNKTLDTQTQNQKVSQQQVQALSQMAFHQYIKETKLLKNKTLQNNIQCVLDLILSRNQRSVTEWRLYLVDDFSTYGFALPSKHIVLYAGLIETAKNQHQMAALLTHLIAAVEDHQFSERLTQNILYESSVSTKNLNVDRTNPIGQKVIASLALPVTDSLKQPFTRRQKEQADETGLKLMIRAGFDPEEALDWWKNVAQKNGPIPTDFYKIHPEPPGRRKNINRIIKKNKDLLDQVLSHLNPPECY